MSNYDSRECRQLRATHARLDREVHEATLATSHARNELIEPKREFERLQDEVRRYEDASLGAAIPTGAEDPEDRRRRARLGRRMSPGAIVYMEVVLSRLRSELRRAREVYERAREKVREAEDRLRKSEYHRDYAREQIDRLGCFDRF